MPDRRSLRRHGGRILEAMGERLRLRAWSVLGVLAAGATALGVACGGGDGGVDPSTCEAAACDGGGASPESSTTDSPSGTDGITPSDAGVDGDADSAVSVSCGDGGAPGTLDQSFGTAGLVRLSIPTSSGNAVAIQPDGRIVIAGDTPTGPGDSLALVRLLPTGALDPTFGNGGLVETTVGTLSQTLLAVAVQPDGKILAAGRTRNSGQPFKLTLVRYLSTGALDTTFGDAGVVLTDTPSGLAGKSILIQSDGRILVAADQGGAQADYVILRYLASGALDSTFGVNGSASIDVRSTGDIVGGLAMGPGGKVVVAGYSVDPNDTNRTDMTTARFEADGGADPGFAASGSFITNFGGGGTRAFDVELDGTGRVLLAGQWKSGITPDDFAVSRITTAGALDTTWGDGGLVTTDFEGRSDNAASVLVQPDGRVILVGPSIPPGGGLDTQGIALARYVSTGVLDPSFGSAGRTLTSPRPNTGLAPAAAALTTCGLIVVGAWHYDLNTALPKYAIGAARYHR